MTERRLAEVLAEMNEKNSPFCLRTDKKGRAEDFAFISNCGNNRSVF
jgi:hypothetical protein